MSSRRLSSDPPEANDTGRTNQLFVVCRDLATRQAYIGDSLLISRCGGASISCLYGPFSGPPSQRGYRCR